MIRTLTLVLALAAPLAAQTLPSGPPPKAKARPVADQHPIVLDLAGGAARHVLVIHNGGAYWVTTIPVEPGPAPVPPGPAPPAPDPSLDEHGIAVRDAALSVPQATRAGTGAALASAYKTMASRAAAGIYTDLEAFLKDNRAQVQQAVGSRAADWKPVFDVIQKRLEDAWGAGSITRPADCVPLWQSFARGIEAAR